MFNTRLLALSIFLLANLTASPNNALAAPTVKKVKEQARAVEKSLASLLKNFKKLTPGNREKVVTAITNSKNDSESDGVADILELTSKARCDSDSDNDGLDDGDEYRNGTKPNDRDSDDDGIDDGDDDDGNGDGSTDSAEIEVKGLLVFKSSSTLTVGTTEFVVNGSTTFRRGANTNATLGDFTVGECLEVEGRHQGATNTAEDVKLDSDCNQ